MACQKERADLKEVYHHSRKWALKVNKMPDEQVLAIHRRLKQQKKIQEK